MAEGTISIGSTTLDTPIGYTHAPIILKTSERAIRGNLFINHAVTPEDQPVDIYRFTITDIVNSTMLAIRAEVGHIGKLDYIDYIQIVEVLSGDGATTTFYTQRRMSADTPVPVVTLGGVAKTVTVTDDIDPAADNVYAKADVSGRARFIFGDVPPDVVDNIIIQYEPKFYVHIPEGGFQRTGIIKDVARYTLICEETK